MSLDRASHPGHVGVFLIPKLESGIELLYHLDVIVLLERDEVLKSELHHNQDGILKVLLLGIFIKV